MISIFPIGVSLSETLYRVTDALSAGIAIPADERKSMALWLVQRQGQAGSYRGLSAPLPVDYHGGAHLYTGEKLVTGASIGHILGEEAARCLIELQIVHPDIEQGMERNRDIIEHFDMRDYRKGMYCCCKCSLALWRHLSVSSIADAESLLSHGIHALADAREGNGRWRSFPFYYTLFTLLGIDMPEATAELRYAAPVCERLLKRSPSGDSLIAKRRQAILHRVLARCG